MSMFDQELADTLEDVYRRRGTSRCQALVSNGSLALRAGRNVDRRCLRQAKQEEHGHWFCLQHAPIWRTHYEILERILEIPPHA